jgi:hypothetical protein
MKNKKDTASKVFRQSPCIKCVNIKKELRNKKQLLKQTETMENGNTKLLYSIFPNDQVNALKRKSTKYMKWSNTTVKKALKLKFSCGSKG